MKNALSAGTTVPPDIPSGIKTLLLPHLPDVGRRDAFVLAIVPLPDILGDLHTGLARETFIIGLAVGCPGQRLLETEIEQLKGPLGSLAGRHVAAYYLAPCLYFIDLMRLTCAPTSWEQSDDRSRRGHDRWP